MPSSGTLLLIFPAFDWIIHPLPAMLLVVVFLKHYTEGWGYSIGIASVLLPRRICPSKFSWETLLNPRVRDAPRNMLKHYYCVPEANVMNLVLLNEAWKGRSSSVFDTSPLILAPICKICRISYFRYLIINFKLCSLV